MKFGRWSGMGNELRSDEGGGGGSDPDYFTLFNSRNAKIIAVLVLAIVLAYHGLLKLLYGEDTCIGLLEEGRYQGEHIWQPYGCMLHMYTQADCRTCMKYKQYWALPNYIVFIGDERLWDVYSSFLTVASTGNSPPPLSPTPSSVKAAPTHSFVENDIKLKMEFYLEPRVDSSVGYLLTEIAAKTSRPNLIIMGAGLETLKESMGSEKAVVEYGFNVSLLLPFIHQLHEDANFLWMLQSPLDESKVNSNLTYLRNRLLDQYNHQATKTLAYSPVKIWKSSRLLSLGYHSDSKDGIKLGPVALNYNTQILLNFYCNDLLNFSDGTCCGNPEPLSQIQLLVLLTFTACVVVRFVLGCLRCRIKELQVPVAIARKDFSGLSPDSSQPPPTSKLATFYTFSRLALIVLFFYSCDRANAFMKENKWFTMFNFFMPVVYLSVLGIFFTEETTKTNFMHRDQTDEWRGWMQLVLLAFHITGAGDVLWIAMIARCLMTGYLFLLGYAHFQYFWTTGDFSLKRVIRVLFRYNFFVLLLCGAMNRPYQFYYFVPAASFWFLLCYATLAIPPHITAASVEKNSVHYLFMVVKLVVFFTLVSILYLSEVFFEKLFLTRPWKALFVTPDDSILSWWFRWWIDRYSAGAGMLLAFLSNFLRRYLILTDSQPSNLFSRRLSLLVAFGSILGISTYAIIVSQCRGKSDCHEIHGYIGVLPVISYLLLRNVFGMIRCRVSTFFAWFGRISLEMFVAQSHVWLAADTHGVLVLLPRWPVFNVILTSFLFVCVAHEIQVLVYQLIPVLIPENDPGIVLRNVVVLLIFCLPLGFLYGAF